MSQAISTIIEPIVTRTSSLGTERVRREDSNAALIRLCDGVVLISSVGWGKAIIGAVLLAAAFWGGGVYTEAKLTCDTHFLTGRDGFTQPICWRANGPAQPPTPAPATTAPEPAPAPTPAPPAAKPRR
jgi:hypothetical protein